MDKKELMKFSLSVYGNITQYNDVLSKARVRIFYKYGNRNGTYITDEFAEKLVSSLPYVPVKGIYDKEEGDYTDHGVMRTEGRIYGVVPENPNFAWEEHLDEDGKVREYACADVLLYTGIYENEALEIAQKAQSMELYASSLEGDWKYIDGKRYFVFTEGCFLGLQVLGDNVKPCFEGAAFYTLYDSIRQIVEKIEQYELKLTDGGAKNMNFKLSDDQKYNMIFDLLNPNFNEAGDWVINYFICDVYDEYAVTFSVTERQYERAYYSKDDKTDSLEITSQERCYIVDVNESEKHALDILQEMNNHTFENVDAKFKDLEGQNNKLNEKIQESEIKIEEYETQVATLVKDKESAETELEETKNNYQNSLDQISDLTEQVDALSEFKKQVETNEKENVINKYSEQLEESVLEPFRNEIDKYTKEELDKELAFVLVQSKPALFTIQNTSSYVPKDDDVILGIEDILNKYENK